jgi:hypothetical protein
MPVWFAHMNEATPYGDQFLVALVSTVATETAVLFLLVRCWFKPPATQLSNALVLFAGVFCSSATLPYLWFVLPGFLKPYALLAIVGESAVFLIEAVFYYFVLRIGWKRSLLVSFVCNLASVLVGWVLMAVQAGP